MNFLIEESCLSIDRVREDLVSIFLIMSLGLEGSIGEKDLIVKFYLFIKSIE